MRLNEKVAIVTGGAKGLGQAMCELFANEGAKVIAVDMMDLTYSHPNVEFYKLNVANSEDVNKFADFVFQKHGKVDILVNNAGITRDAMTRKMTDEQFDVVISVNLKGVFNMTRAFGPRMEEANYGSIINISSVVGVYGNIGQANYAASKAGVIGMSKSWAKEFARKGANVRCNAIAPGYIMTDMMKTVPEDLLKKFADLTMLKRLGQPHEIAYAALYLASEESSYVTGQVLEVNGGMRL